MRVVNTAERAMDKACVRDRVQLDSPSMARGAGHRAHRGSALKARHPAPSLLKSELCPRVPIASI